MNADSTRTVVVEPGGTQVVGHVGLRALGMFADVTGEALAGELRPGNAAANDVADLLWVLDAAVCQLPATVAAGHGEDGDPVGVRHRVVVRSDSVGGTKAFIKGVRARNTGALPHRGHGSRNTEAAPLDALAYTSMHQHHSTERHRRAHLTHPKPVGTRSTKGRHIEHVPIVAINHQPRLRPTRPRLLSPKPATTTSATPKAPNHTHL